MEKTEAVKILKDKGYEISEDKRPSHFSKDEYVYRLIGIRKEDKTGDTMFFIKLSDPNWQNRVLSFGKRIDLAPKDKSSRPPTLKEIEALIFSKYGQPTQKYTKFPNSKPVNVYSYSSSKMPIDCVYILDGMAYSDDFYGQKYSNCEELFIVRIRAIENRKSGINEAKLLEIDVVSQWRKRQQHEATQRRISQKGRNLIDMEKWSQERKDVNLPEL